MVSYNLEIHTTAKRELDSFDDEDRERLTDELVSVAEMRQPTQHESVRMLEGQPGLFRVRVGNLRAICTLEKPSLFILRVGRRKNVYDVVDDLGTRLDAIA